MTIDESYFHRMGSVRTQMAAVDTVEGCDMVKGRHVHVSGRCMGPQDVVQEPIPMILFCPECGTRHVDKYTYATKPHHTHACQTCGFVWRPAIVSTVGVQFLPGFKDGPQEGT